MDSTGELSAERIPKVRTGRAKHVVGDTIGHTQRTLTIRQKSGSTGRMDSRLAGEVGDTAVQGERDLHQLHRIH